MADQAPFGVWTPADFIDLGTRDAVDQALHRLTRAGDIRRIVRGLYDKPGFNSLTAKPTNPDPRAVIDALARRDKYRMMVDGITAANDLGLSDAVPARIVVHTDARLKPLELGNLRIDFRLTAPSKLYWAGRPAMRVVQALHWLKDTLAADRSRAPKTPHRDLLRSYTWTGDPRRPSRWPRGVAGLDANFSEGHAGCAAQGGARCRVGGRRGHSCVRHTSTSAQFQRVRRCTRRACR